jgi:uncharacterized protein (DUF4415 family)
MPDERIDTSDIPELGPEFWRNAKVVLPESKEVVTLRIDRDVVTWYKEAGKGYQSRMNAVLRSYMEHSGILAAPDRRQGSGKGPEARR